MRENSMKQNVVLFDSQPRTMGAARKEMPPTDAPRVGFVTRFLLWTGLLMDASTKSGETKWNSGFLFILALLFGTIFAGFVILLGIIGFFFLDIKEDWRGSEAWRSKEIYDQRADYKRKCEANATRQKGLIEFARGKGIEVPPEFLIIEQCQTVEKTAQPQGEH